MNGYDIPWLETAERILPFVNAVIGSALATMFFAGFVIPRYKMLPRRAAYAIFWGACFLFQFAERALMGGSINALFRIIIFMGFVFALSLVLFKPNIKLHVFLLFGFFAVREISFFITVSANELTGRISHAWVVHQIQTEVLVHMEDILHYLKIIGIIDITLFHLTFAVITFVSLRKIMRRFEYKTLSLNELFYLLLPCLSGLMLSFILRRVMLPDDYELQLVLFGELPVISVLVIFAGVIMLFALLGSISLFQSLVKSYGREKEIAVMQRQMHQLQGQVHDMDGIYTEIKGMRHDMKSHLSNIRLLMHAKGKEAELEEYLGKFEDTLSKFEFMYQTGNSVSDIIIHQKYLEAIGNGIELSADFIYPARLGLDVYDLAVILNNGLENALEACKKMDGGKPYIRLRAFAKGEMFIIEIENNFAGDVAVNGHTGLPVSSKPNGGAHGMGLANIQRCARKYLGDMDFQICETNVFRLTVMLQGKCEK